MWDREPRADGSILEENLLESAGDVSLGSKFIFQQEELADQVLGSDQIRFMSRSEFNRKSKT